MLSNVVHLNSYLIIFENGLPNLTSATVKFFFTNWYIQMYAVQYKIPTMQYNIKIPTMQYNIKVPTMQYNIKIPTMQCNIKILTMHQMRIQIGVYIIREKPVTHATMFVLNDSTEKKKQHTKHYLYIIFKKINVK